MSFVSMKLNYEKAGKVCVRGVLKVTAMNNLLHCVPFITESLKTRRTVVTSYTVFIIWYILIFQHHKPNNKRIKRGLICNLKIKTEYENVGLIDLQKTLVCVPLVCIVPEIVL